MYSRCFVKSGAAVKYISLALLYLSSCTLLYLSGKGVEVIPSAAAAEPPATPGPMRLRPRSSPARERHR